MYPAPSCVPAIAAGHDLALFGGFVGKAHRDPVGRRMSIAMMSRDSKPLSLSISIRSARAASILSCGNRIEIPFSSCRSQRRSDTRNAARTRGRRSGTFLQCRVDFRRPALRAVIDHQQQVGVAAVDFIRDDVTGFVDDRHKIAALPQGIGDAFFDVDLKRARIKFHHRSVLDPGHLAEAFARRPRRTGQRRAFVDFQRFQDLEFVDFTLAGEFHGFDAEAGRGQERIGDDTAVPPYDYSITNC